NPFTVAPKIFPVGMMSIMGVLEGFRLKWESPTPNRNSESDTTVLALDWRNGLRQAPLVGFPDNFVIRSLRRQALDWSWTSAAGLGCVKTQAQECLNRAAPR